MANKGLKEENTMLSFELGDIKVSIDLALGNQNVIVYIPLTLNKGPKPINVGIFYNDQNKNNSSMFGKGFKFSEEKIITSISYGYKITNADGSENEFFYDSHIEDGALYKDIYGNKLEDLTYDDYSQFRLLDKQNNFVVFEDDSQDKISIINVLDQ